MVNKILIRRIREDDGEKISQISAAITQAQVKVNFEEIAAMEARKAEDASFVAVVNDEVVGYMISYIVSGLFGIEKSAWITMLGVDPKYMGIGPSVAIPKVLEHAGMTMDQIELWEINEAFASQAVYCTEKLGIRDHELLNPRGSGISLGHPLGCTGTRIAVTLMHEMPCYGVRYAVESMCIGHGQGAAAIWEWIG